MGENLLRLFDQVVSTATHWEKVRLGTGWVYTGSQFQKGQSVGRIKMIQMSKLGSIVVLSLLVLVLVVPLFGHVSVNPRTTEAGIHHKIFYIRAPVEKEIPVVEIGVEVSEEWRQNGGDLNSFQDIPGMDLHVDFDDDGKVERVWWTGEGAVVETFQMFYVSMNVPEKAGVYPFKSWQKYTDGSVVWWNEPRGEDVANPYPVVTVTRPPFLTAGMVQVGSSAIALLALSISLLSFRNHRKNGA
jgi:uncharacterized protein YcnI